jgi:ABC-type uncharacterized transport system auxiliary subunit
MDLIGICIITHTFMHAGGLAVVTQQSLYIENSNGTIQYYFKACWNQRATQVLITLISYLLFII